MQIQRGVVIAEMKMARAKEVRLLSVDIILARVSHYKALRQTKGHIHGGIQQLPWQRPIALCTDCSSHYANYIDLKSQII